MAFFLSFLLTLLLFLGSFYSPICRILCIPIFNRIRSSILCSNICKNNRNRSRQSTCNNNTNLPRMIIGGIPSLTKNVKGTVPNLKDFSLMLAGIIIVLLMLIFHKSSSNITFDIMNTKDYIMLGLVGIIAAITMVVPGISGSLDGYYNNYYINNKMYVKKENNKFNFYSLENELIATVEKLPTEPIYRIRDNAFTSHDKNFFTILYDNNCNVIEKQKIKFLALYQTRLVRHLPHIPKVKVLAKNLQD